jgi:superfamily I DNA/RNA helicase
MEKRIIYGPPGTGKTTFLLDLISEELKTTSAYRVAFVSFTKKGSYEGAARAKNQFNLKDIDLTHFRTIHSLCFKAIGAHKYDMLGKEHYRHFSKITGISFTGYYTSDFHSTNDEYLHALSMEKHNPKLAWHLTKKLNAKKYTYIKYQFAEMKKQLGILDFDDLLELYLEHGEPLKVITAFIDEAQDLTTLQWKVVTKMFANAEKIIVAGDDDQAVYEWSGADVIKFLKFSPKSTILRKSYRLPDEVLVVAKRVSDNIRQRKKKTFTSNETTGFVDIEGGLDTINFLGGELVLARTNYLLKKAAGELFEQGISYSLKGKLSVDKMIVKAIQSYNAFKNGDISEQEFMKFRGQFRDISTNSSWKNEIKLSTDDVSYYEKILSQNAETKSPVKLETFHSCKGSENDHVILITDLSKRVYDELYSNIDSELRCLYVGVTRAKKRLTIVAPNQKYCYPQTYFN